MAQPRRSFLVRLDAATHRRISDAAHRQSLATGRRVHMAHLLARALHESPLFRSGFAVEEAPDAPPEEVERAMAEVAASGAARAILAHGPAENVPAAAERPHDADDAKE